MDILIGTHLFQRAVANTEAGNSLSFDVSHLEISFSSDYSSL